MMMKALLCIETFYLGISNMMHLLLTVHIYGYETLPMSVKDEKRMATTEMRMVR